MVVTFLKGFCLNQYLVVYIAMAYLGKNSEAGVSIGVYVNAIYSGHRKRGVRMEAKI